MIKRLIGLLAAAATIAVTVFTAMGYGSYRSMLFADEAADRTERTSAVCDTCCCDAAAGEGTPLRDAAEQTAADSVVAPADSLSADSPGDPLSADAPDSLPAAALETLPAAAPETH